MQGQEQVVPGIVGQYASFWPRVGARLVDFAIIGVAYGIALLALTYAGARGWAGPAAMMAVGLIVPVVAFAYLVWFTVRTGETPGKMFMGLKVLRANGEASGVRASVARCAIDALCMSLLGFGGVIDYLWVLGRRSRALHDLAAGTVVLHVRPMPTTWRIVLALVLASLAGNVVNTKALVLRGQVGLPNMAPTIRKGEYWLANGLVYRYRSPRMGEVVAFRREPPSSYPQFVGRVVGLPGDLIALRGGQIVGVAPNANGSVPPDSIWVPPGSVAVAGDNRDSVASAAYPIVPFPPPPPGPKGLNGYDPFAPQLRPILVVRTSDVLGQVQLAGRIIPIWGTRVVR